MAFLSLKSEIVGFYSTLTKSREGSSKTREVGAVVSAVI
jgi:hypothetical protein